MLQLSHQYFSVVNVFLSFRRLIKNFDGELLFLYSFSFPYCPGLNLPVHFHNALPNNLSRN